MGNYANIKNYFSLEVIDNNQLRYIEFTYEYGNHVILIDYKLNPTRTFDGNQHSMSIVRDVENNKLLFYLEGLLEETLTLIGKRIVLLKDNVKLDEINYFGTDLRKTYF